MPLDDKGESVTVVKPSVEACVQFVSVGRDFGDVEALRSVSFEVARGSVCGLIGPNGAGKSTIIRLIVGALTPTSGSVFVNGANAPFSASSREKISWVAESPALYTRMTVRANLALAAAFYRVQNHDARIRSVLDQVGMPDAADRRVSTLSNGQKRRVSIARALLNTPELLVMDEPSAGLDIESAATIYEVVSRVSKNSGTTVIVTTHRLEEVARICDDVLVVNSGTIVFQGPPSELARAGNSRVVSVTADGVTDDAVRAIHALDGVRKVVVLENGLEVSVDFSFDASLLNQMLIENGARVARIGEDRQAIEKAFMALTGPANQ